jgi:hypothetical protein
MTKQFPDSFELASIFGFGFLAPKLILVGTILVLGWHYFGFWAGATFVLSWRYFFG